MNRLIMKKRVLKEKIVHGRDEIYYLTSKGAEFSELPKLTNISLGGYYHTVSLVDLYLKLRSFYPDMAWVSERHLRSDKYLEGKRGHLADGMLIIENKEIAIELKLTLKKQHRLQKILKGYSANFNIDEVWYFCSKRVLPAVVKASSKLNYVKCYNFDEFLRADRFG
jgi:hypothetical protein